MKNQKKLLLNLVFSLLCIVFPLTVNAAQQANLGEENRTLEVGAESQLLVPETKGNIKWKCNKKIVKIKKIKGSKKQALHYFKIKYIKWYQKITRHRTQIQVTKKIKRKMENSYHRQSI